MREEKWQDIKGQIKDDFELLEEKKESLGEDRPGDKEIIVFNGPIGKMKLEFITHPVVLEKKGVGSRRIGSEATVEYKYSEDEFVHTFKAYKWDEDRDDWIEMEAERTGFSL